jgi:50S ribosomal protein L16 3-hydroxylase
MAQDDAIAAGWRDFVAQYWTSKPYEGPFFIKPPFDIDALWEVAARGCPGSLFYRPDGPVILDPERYCPRPEDGGFDGYAGRLARCLPDGGFFQLNNLQAVDLAIYDWAREFLRGLFDALGGMPPARAWLDIMFGQYKTTPVGIHRGEPGGVFMFVLDGHKQMLLWPPDTENIKDDTLKYDELRADAEVQEASEGSVCYWPGEWWHVGESPTGPSLSFHITVHLLRGMEIALDAMEGLKSGYAIDQHLAPTAAAAYEMADGGLGRILTQLTSAEGKQREVEAHMQRLSAVCLQQTPPMGTVRPPEPGVLVAVDPRFPILVAETAPGRMSCAANGHMFRIDSSQRLTRLVEQLNTGEPADVKTLCEQFAAADSSSDPLDKQTLLGVLARFSAARALLPTGV